MKIKTVLLALVMFFGPALGFVDRASADPTPNCDILSITVAGAGDGWFVEATKCNHGKASREDDVDILLLPVDEGFYGPDCEIVIEKKDATTLDKNRYVYRVGQGICSIKYKAGNIHVEQKGEWSLQYQVQKGSYADDRGGVVTFNIP
ncbi:MAG: hypothetical protein K9K66_08110 [Desulfarculaceae bacterium]|nr:hypothetical protein [Desulfarculaceae bacterium]MCF8072090.1 hypothetical protein [Desulfarculaceae bacterium]MCF8101607.1 hypothetical protein [Desulfarculaceae bacterium]MCF8115157.1 hypothetical protein [Desulfarculaceae bacterium]